LEAGLSEVLAADELEVVRTGEICAIAEPGRAGRLFFVVNAAFFCAIRVSRRLGLLDIVLLDIPRPGRGGSAFLGEFGLFGSLVNSFCAVGSKSAMIL
jgi:hypothetical protein